jgi:hypothetical protein
LPPCGTKFKTSFHSFLSPLLFVSKLLNVIDFATMVIRYEKKIKKGGCTVSEEFRVGTIVECRGEGLGNYFEIVEIKGNCAFLENRNDQGHGWESLEKLSRPDPKVDNLRLVQVSKGNKRHKPKWAFYLNYLGRDKIVPIYCGGEQEPLPQNRLDAVRALIEVGAITEEEVLNASVERY